MKYRRHLRFGCALFAAVLHLAVPVGAYGGAVHAAASSDFCSATSTVPAALSERGLPIPASGEHHCAHAPCCAGAAAHAAAPPPDAAATLRVALLQTSTPAARAAGVPVIAVTAAQPRGPPPLS
jgi:hypothetical protein